MFVNEDQEPAFMRFVREFAAKEGISAEEFLKRDLKRAQSPDTPTGDCIAPDVAQGIVDLGCGIKEINIPLDWIEVAKKHAEHCLHCRIMVASMTPPKKA